MARTVYYMINAITLYRLLAAPLLIFLAFIHQLNLFRRLLAISFCTDAFDGYLARKYKTTSIFGAKLDSVADDFTVIAAIIGIILFRPGFLVQEVNIIILLLSLFLLQNICAFARYKRMSNFHTYTAKVAAIAQGIFLVLFFFVPKPGYTLFYIAAITTIVDLVEEIILVLVLREWQANVKGLYWVMKKRKRSQ